MHFYTSINNNYLPKARILAKSIKQHCENAKVSLVLCDQIPEEIDIQQEPFDEILTIEELGIPVENLKMWIYTHTVVELCTAVKGQALVKFLESGSEKVVYLDPDIAVFNNLKELEKILDQQDVVLTPHQTIPETNKRDIANNEICSLKHGTYNFGFYAVKNSEKGLKFARWWRDRLIDFCFDDIPNGLFTDQKWGDLVPALFEGVHILKDPGCNVSTWNLSNREVTKDSEGLYYVNGQLLKFYHFSGFDSGAQEIMLNEYANGNNNLYDLRNWYIERQKEEEQEKYSKYPCVYNYYGNGVKIEKEERKFIKDRLDVYEYFKDTDPHVVNQEKSYYLWYIDEMRTRNGNKESDQADLHFYTSINNNYLPKARVLAKTIKKFCPLAKFSLVLCDTLPSEVDLEKEPFDYLLNVEDLGIPTENLDFWIYTHTVVELCTAVKGQALVKLLEEGAKKVIYLDPDIAVFDNLQEINNLLEKHDVLLTPHQTLPETTKEDVIANEICSLMHGTYNFGFYAVKNSENGLRFARWWRDRLVDFCFDDIPNGLFTDQKWGDLVPALFNGVYILKDAGCNVCTWNLSNREVTKDDQGKYLVNGEKLKFYHFSGFDSGAQASMLDKYSKGNVYLYELRDWYQEMLKNEEQAKYEKFPSTYNFYSDGTKILDKHRILLRRRTDLLEYFKNTNPYVIEQEKSYYKWFVNEELQLGKEIMVDERGMIVQLETELNRIYASKSWQLVQRLKKLKDMFRR